MNIMAFHPILVLPFLHPSIHPYSTTVTKQAILPLLIASTFFHCSLKALVPLSNYDDISHVSRTYFERFSAKQDVLWLNILALCSQNDVSYNTEESIETEMKKYPILMKLEVGQYVHILCK